MKSEKVGEGERRRNCPEVTESTRGSDPSKEVSGAGSGGVPFGSRCFIGEEGGKGIHLSWL